MGAPMPRDERGRFLSKTCPECGDGRLHREGDGYWHCDGLIDPEDVTKELEPCYYTTEQQRSARP